jgi:hypothetical protein
LEYQLVGTYHNVTLDEDRRHSLRRHQPFRPSLKFGVEPHERKRVGYVNFDGVDLPLQGRWEHFRTRDEFFILFDSNASTELQYTKQVLVERIESHDVEFDDFFRAGMAKAQYKGKDHVRRQIKIRFNECYKRILNPQSGRHTWLEAPEGWLQFGIDHLDAPPPRMLLPPPAPPPPPPRTQEFVPFAGEGRVINVADVSVPVEGLVVAADV